MLNFIDTLPTDKQIAGVHCIPINEQGMIMLAWDKEEQLITTIGGRVENSETLEEALVREVMEEVGITLMEEKIPFASWYWSSTDTYTVWYLSKVKTLGKYDFQNEKTGYLISNFLTFEMLITQLENKYAPRLQILQLAKKKAMDCNGSLGEFVKLVIHFIIKQNLTLQICISNTWIPIPLKKVSLFLSIYRPPSN